MVPTSATQVVLLGKNLPASAGDGRDASLIPGSGRSPGGGHGCPLWYSCLENSHRQRSQEDYCPWGHKELDMTEQLSLSFRDFPGGSDGKASVYNAGDPGSIPGLERSSGEGNGNPLQYYCLENPMYRGAW